MLGGGGDGQRRSGPAKIQDLNQQKLAGKNLSIDVDFKSLGPGLLDKFLQFFPANVDADRVGRLRAAISDCLSQCAEAYGFEKSTRAPRAPRHADIETFGLRRV